MFALDRSGNREFLPILEPIPGTDFVGIQAWMRLLRSFESRAATRNEAQFLRTRQSMEGPGQLSASRTFPFDGTFDLRALASVLNAMAEGGIRGALQRLCQDACTSGRCSSAAVADWTSEGLRLVAASGVEPSQLARLLRGVKKGAFARPERSLQLGSFRALPLRRAGRIGGLLLAEARGSAGANEVLKALGDAAGALLALESKQASDRRARRQLLSASVRLREQIEHHDSRALRMRHDLKTPLVAMKGYVDMMLRGLAGPLNERMLKYLQRLAQAVDHQRKLIDAELGPAWRDCARMVDFDRLLRRVAERMTGAAAERGCLLELERPRDRAWLPGNRDQLELLCFKLFRIALRQTRPARILATLSTSQDFLEIKIRSSSPWEPQVDEFRLCHEIVRRHGGQLFVNEGEQVVIEVQLPRDKAAERWLQLSGAERSSAAMSDRGHPA